MTLAGLISRGFYYLRMPELRDCFRIPTHLTDKEKACLYGLVSDSADRWSNKCDIVEIGSYLGASSCFLAAGLEKLTVPGKILCIDTWENHAMTEGTKDTMADFLANTRHLSRHIVPVRGWSTEVIDIVRESIPTIELLFIDGDHSYEGCLADWRAYSPLLSDKAIVVMHDIGWAEGVQRVVEQEVRPRVSREGRLPNMWWGWIDK